MYTNQLLFLGRQLIEANGGKGAYVGHLAQVLLVFAVDLAEAHAALELAGECLEDGREHLAMSAPARIKVNQPRLFS